MKKITGLLAAVTLTGWVGTAGAGVIIDVTEVAGDVVFTVSGSLDLTGATSLTGYPGYNIGFIPGGSNWYLAPGPGGAVDAYALSLFDGVFGSSLSFFDSPSSISGDNFYIWAFGPQVGVTAGYTSGSAINSSMTFAGATIAGFTMNSGTYNYAIPNDTITLRIGGSTTPVPAPATLALFGVGLAGLGWSRRKKA